MQIVQLQQKVSTADDKAQQLEATEQRLKERVRQLERSLEVMTPSLWCRAILRDESFMLGCADKSRTRMIVSRPEVDFSLTGCPAATEDGKGRGQRQGPGVPQGAEHGTQVSSAVQRSRGREV